MTRAAIMVLLLALAAVAPARAEDLGPAVLHDPVLEREAEQGILRPVPIEVALPDKLALAARRVLVHYRPWGFPDWVTLELLRVDRRYLGAIPCLEISTITGDVRYYIRVHDVDGRVIATGASRAEPYRVKIKHDTMLTKGQQRVKKCPDPADCPPGLLGCPSPRVKEIRCSADGDCEGGQTCSWRGVCETTERRTAWPSVSVQQDFGFVRTAGACSISAQENEGYACYRSDGAQYIGNPVLSDEPIGGAVGPTRIVVGYDHLLDYRISVGVRLGWAVRGAAPKTPSAIDFIPISGALRVSRWFGDDPFAATGLRPYVFVTAGYAMTDLKTSAHVREDPLLTPFQGGNDLEQTLEVYHRAGDGIVGAGAGLAVAPTPFLMTSLELSLIGAFPVAALMLAPSLGVAFGF